MENNLRFNSSICTSRSQSERLLALGLKKETADMMFIGLVKDFRGEDVPNAERVYSLCCWYEETSMSVGLEKREYIPAWSLHRLLCLLPREYIYDIDFQQIMRDFVFGLKDMYDEVISCIETLIKEGYFYEEYLEE
jgi:hypothetical protein